MPNSKDMAKIHEPAIRHPATIRNVKAEQRDELNARFGESVKFDVPLAGLSTFRIGGPAEALLEPRSAEDVALGLRAAATLGIRWIVVGLGSNILAADEGFAGLVIRMGKGLFRLSTTRRSRLC